MDNRINILMGDIVRIKVDAIVNSANKSLLRGFGVDGVIHAAAGKFLEDECKTLGGCDIGDAKITQSYNLKNSSWIIHAVGPQWIDGQHNEKEKLRNAYINSLKLINNYKTEYMNQCLKLLNKYNLDKNTYITLKNDITNYINSNPIKTISYPSISTGIYNFPINEAAKIALQEINKFLQLNEYIEKIYIVCFNKITYDEYLKIINNI